MVGLIQDNLSHAAALVQRPRNSQALSKNIVVQAIVFMWPAFL